MCVTYGTLLTEPPLGGYLLGRTSLPCGLLKIKKTTHKRVRTHSRGNRTFDASEEMVLRDPGLSAAPHVVKAAAATKATLMLLLTR